MKTCPKCKTEKDESQFNRCSARKNGLTWCCKLCSKKYQQTPKSREARKKRVAKYRTPDFNKRNHLKLAYGLLLEDWKRMLNHQGGVCAICKQSSDKMCVDHDHDSGRIRGLLCFSCNVGIGNLKDSIAIVSSALEYLTEHSCKT